MNKAALEFTQEEPEESPRITFGAALRFARRQSVDPQRGGMLTQERLGELIGDVLGDAGYSGAAISEWERNKSRIHAADRRVLLALLTVLVTSGGLPGLREANELLVAGDYRRLDASERLQLFKTESAGQSEDELFLAESARSATGRPRNLVLLLDKVEGFWIEGVLRASLATVPTLNLGIQLHIGAIDHPWSSTLGESVAGRRFLESETIEEAYEHAGKALLILGEPGSGKTTTLLQLAASLLRTAREDSSAAAPVILDLSGWAKQRLPLSQWVVEELTAKYQIPREDGRSWLAANELALLLDGLDALTFEARQACIDAINRYREEHGLGGLVVCSRTAEYVAVQVKLRLGGAASIQPLTRDQVDAFLTSGGEESAPLAAALATVPGLASLAENPLMLTVMAATVNEGSEFSTGSDWLAVFPATLFEAYVARAFARRPYHPDYAPAETRRRLGWLARRLTDANQVLFLIEGLQPSWLPDKKARRLYMLLSGVTSGLVGGVMMWLLWRILRLTLPQLPAPTSDWLAALIGLPSAATEPITIVLGNAALGLLLGLVLFALFERRICQPVAAEDIRRTRRRQMTLVGVLTAAVTFLFVQFFAEPLLALAWAVAEGFMYGAAARYLFGWSYETEVRPVEALGWSWRLAAMGAANGLILALIAELIESALYGYNGMWRTVSTLLLAGVILGGLSGRAAVASSRPNQGIWLSLRNAATAAVVLALPIYALTWSIRGPLYATYAALLAALVAASLMGMAVFFRHFLLRAMLRGSGQIPWRYGRFLDHGAQLALLRKVGGGYLFAHTLLQAHLAEN